MVDLQVLGSAQDGGVPHISCTCKNCIAALDNPNRQRMVASLAMVADQNNYVIDATPNFNMQASYLKRVYPEKPLGFDGLFLTHLHIGHYAGLIQLGKEAASTTNFPVYMSNSVHEFLSNNRPFSYLLERNEIKPIIFKDRTPIQLDTDLTITPLEVPHRNEDGDTHGFIITNPIQDQSALYIPDIDVLSQDTIRTIKRMDITFFDGTFYQSEEIDRQEEVPHPPMVDTISALDSVDHGSFYFTHFNHTNPVINKGREYEYITDLGFDIADDGLVLKL